jgi:histidyl-tRNA synthetase
VETRAAYRGELQAHLRANEDRLSDEVRGRIELNPLRAFDADHPGTREVMATAPRLLDFLDADDAAHFAAVLELLDATGVAYEVDPTLVRGLDYYARTVFEVHSTELGAQSALGGGGRYDGLVHEIGGPATPGMGWAAGIERILLAGGAPPHAAPPVDLVVGGTIGALEFRLAADARAAGLHAQLDLAGRSLKGLLKHAGRLDARYVAWVDDVGEAQLKDLQTGEQSAVPVDAIVRDVLRGPGL